MLLRSRIVLPISSPPIRDGAVIVSNGRIVAVGRWADLKSAAGRAIDLDDVILMPGLVNAHCHLDYTNMVGEFPPPKVFTDWLKLITTAKSLWSVADYRQSWETGARMLIRTGTTAVGDIEAVPELLPAMWEKTPLRVHSFLELIGITGRRSPEEIIQEATKRILSLKGGNGSASLSPHAPYSTLPRLLRLSAQTGRKKRLPLSIHVAESALEFEMFTRGRGQMFEWLERNNRDMSDCKRGTPVEHLARCGILSQNLIAVHANYLRPTDVELLGSRKVHIVHCPRSHAYFRHKPFQARALLRAGANVCLGTDSLASVFQQGRKIPRLDMFAEMRSFARYNKSFSPRRIVEMSTINGARALGLQAGELKRGAHADLIAVPFKGKLADASEAVLHHEGDIAASMIGGRWAVAPEHSRTDE